MGQLAIDTLIVTLGAQRVGYLEAEEVLAVAGNDAFTALGSGVLSTALDVFYLPSREIKDSQTGNVSRTPAITLVQQRAPVVRGHNAAFAQRLLQAFILSHRLAHVLLLLSADASRRIDSQIEGSQIRFLATREATNAMHLIPSSATSWIDTLQQAQILPMEQPTTDLVLKNGSFARCLFDQSGGNPDFEPPQRAPLSHFDVDDLGYTTTEPHASMAASSVQTSSLAMTMLVHFVHEGYNFPEGLALASTVASLLRLFPKDEKVEWVLPSSWRHVIASPAFDKRLF